VLVVGGTDGVNVFATTELCDPAKHSWIVTGSLIPVRYGHPATLLADGKVLVAGGADEHDFITETASTAAGSPSFQSIRSNAGRTRSLNLFQWETFQGSRFADRLY